MRRLPAAAALLALATPATGQGLLLGVGGGTILGSAGSIAAPSLALGGGSGGTFDSGNAEGWVLQCVTCTAGQTFTVSRQGYNTSGTAVTFNETRTIMKALRKAYFIGFPASVASAGSSNWGATTVRTDNLWALDDYVLSTDTVAGYTNSSTLIAPKPVCNWDSPPQQLYGNTITVSIACFSRDAGANGIQGQVANVSVTLDDGAGHTMTQSTGAMSKTPRAGDISGIVIQDYQLSFDTTGVLNDNTKIKVDADVKPIVGSTGSILHTTDTSVIREFSTRYVLKNTDRFTNRWYAAACPTIAGSCTAVGTLTGGKWATTSAGAFTNPFLSPSDAISKASAGTGTGISAQSVSVGTALPVGAVDGAIIYQGQGAAAGSALYNTTATETLAPVTITRDPAITQANAVVYGGASGNVRPGLSGLLAGVTEVSLQFNDVTLHRSSANAIFQTNGVTPQLRVIFDNMTFDNVTTANGGNKLSANTHLYAYGVTMLNDTTGFVAAGGVGVTEVRALRAITNANGGSYENFLLLGSNIPGSTLFGSGGRCDDKSIIAFNSLLNDSQSTVNFSFGACTISSGIVFVSNVMEATGTDAAGAVTFTLGTDSGPFVNISNAIVQYNTLATTGNVGRQFIAYNTSVSGSVNSDGTNPARKFTFFSVKNNILGNVVSKQDVFVGQMCAGVSNCNLLSDANKATNRTGGWATHYGVGWADNQFLYNQTNGAESFFNEAYGRRPLRTADGSAVNTLNSAFFVSDQSSTVTVGGVYTAGAGGGNYHLTVSSLCKGAVPASGLPYTLDGTARNATGDNCGAY